MLLLGNSVASHHLSLGHFFFPGSIFTVAAEIDPPKHTLIEAKGSGNHHICSAAHMSRIRERTDDGSMNTSST
jgi:hypothetical protein